MNKLIYNQDNLLYVSSDAISSGDIVKIGSEQWLCLCVDKNHALFISHQLLDLRSFHVNDHVSISYKDGSIREYLNHNFLIYNFKRDFIPLIEKNQIIINDDIIDDRVFLMSIEEVNQYMSNYQYRIALDKFNCNEPWWLRNQSEDYLKAYYVDKDGSIGGYPLNHYCKLGLRPAFWLKLNHEIDYNKINTPIYADNSKAIDKPYIGMNETDIENTKCGPYYNATLFENYHVYSWMSYLDCRFLQVSIQDEKVTNVLEMYGESHWNKNGSPIYKGIKFCDK